MVVAILVVGCCVDFVVDYVVPVVAKPVAVAVALVAVEDNVAAEDLLVVADFANSELD